MNAKETYKIWAPSSKKWTDWIRPVPFIGIDTPKEIKEIIDFEIPTINYLPENINNTAIIIDTTGINSIKEGIALAKQGYRPIPIFNGTNPPPKTYSTTNNSIIEPLLVWGAEQLKNIEIKDDAPPAFLLDKNRLNRYKIDRGTFDNSWDIYPQDIPSYKYLQENKIDTIIIKGEKVNKDLEKVLYKFQKNKINILFTNGYENPKKVKLKKPKEKEL